VGVADDPTDDGRLPADFTLLGHIRVSLCVGGSFRRTENAQV
jgi:hypothetical protein